MSPSPAPLVAQPGVSVGPAVQEQVAHRLAVLDGEPGLAVVGGGAVGQGGEVVVAVPGCNFTRAVT